MTPETLSWRDGDPELVVTRWREPCGLEVIVHADPTVPRVACHVWYRVGSSDEGAGSSGFAHLYEHLFKESLHLAGQRHYELLRRAGASNVNASTSADRTAYHETVPAEALELALWLEADRMGYFLPALTQARLDGQKAVVRNERRQRYENVAFGGERFAIAAALYPEGHPARYLTIGRHEDIEDATLAQVADFYRTWYVPANAVLVLAGDVEIDLARAAVGRWFGSFPASARPVRPTPSAPPLTSPVREVLHDRFAAVVRIHRVWRGPAAGTADAFALDAAVFALVKPGSGVLWRRLIREGRLAHAVSAWVETNRLGGEFHVAVDAPVTADRAAIRAILDEELARVAAQADAAVIARVRRRTEAGTLWRLDGLERRANQLLRSMLHLERPDGIATELARVRAVDPAAVVAAARTWLAPEAMIEIETVPGAAP
ncbi:MAG: insulinase family protein [Deltaproteobacteria bacterium]|nr:insulinase family protein [Deltaproteobacteria bacterium]